METDEQVDQGIEEAVAECFVRTGRPQDPAVGQREVEVAGDQDGFELTV